MAAQLLEKLEAWLPKGSFHRHAAAAAATSA